MLIIACVALILAVIPSYLAPFCTYDLDIFGTLSTILSIVLSVISILYTWISGEKTLKDLKQIQKDNQSMIDEITRLKSKSNYNYENIENAFESEI